MLFFFFLDVVMRPELWIRHWRLYTGDWLEI